MDLPDLVFDHQNIMIKLRQQQLRTIIESPSKLCINKPTIFVEYHICTTTFAKWNVCMDGRDIIARSFIDYFIPLG